MDVKQPSYEAWKSIEAGMPLDEVVDSLGQPVSNRLGPLDYCFGYLRSPYFPSCPFDYSFIVQCDSDMRVESKIDPFGGRFSPDGRPMRPELIIPSNDLEFSHYPRILDVRWHPVAGKYPITYSVEIGYLVAPLEATTPFPEDWKRISPELDYQDEVVEPALEEPYFCDSFVGACPGRVRVKAKNELGESDWSEYRYFRFLR